MRDPDPVCQQEYKTRHIALPWIIKICRPVRPHRQQEKRRVRSRFPHDATARIFTPITTTPLPSRGNSTTVKLLDERRHQRLQRIHLLAGKEIKLQRKENEVLMRENERGGVCACVRERQGKRCVYIHHPHTSVFQSI